jgi:hypothetical protein
MVAVFRETSASERTSALPLSQLSVEIGHLYMEDLAEGAIDLDDYFARIAPWVDPAVLASAARVPRPRLRASTCLLIDDYFGTLRSPAQTIPEIVAAATAAGLRIDYLARESACAQPAIAPGALDADPAALAEIVESQIVADPPLGASGSRPAPQESGWLSNGQRSPVRGTPQAMTSTAQWEPPSENGARRHSIFLDVEMWSESHGERLWSCPLLAAVWQLLRLGLLRFRGRNTVSPVDLALDGLPASWADLPAVARLNPRAAPFFAYRTLTVMDGRFLAVEHAVRTILSQVASDPVALEQTVSRAAAEKIVLPVETPARLSYVFLGA